VRDVAAAAAGRLSAGQEGDGGAEYCVKGSSATVRVEEEGLTFVYQIKRK
jgi:hypothetical protein